MYNNVGIMTCRSKLFPLYNETCDVYAAMYCTDPLSHISAPHNTIAKFPKPLASLRKFDVPIYTYGMF